MEWSNTFCYLHRPFPAHPAIALVAVLQRAITSLLVCWASVGGNWQIILSQIYSEAKVSFSSGKGTASNNKSCHPIQNLLMFHSKSLSHGLQLHKLSEMFPHHPAQLLQPAFERTGTGWSLGTSQLGSAPRQTQGIRHQQQALEDGPGTDPPDTMNVQRDLWRKTIL